MGNPNPIYLRRVQALQQPFISLGMMHPVLGIDLTALEPKIEAPPSSLWRFHISPGRKSRPSRRRIVPWYYIPLKVLYSKGWSSVEIPPAVRYPAGAEAPWEQPRISHSSLLQAKVRVQARGVVPVQDEGFAFTHRRNGRRLRSFLEVSLAAIFVKPPGKPWGPFSETVPDSFRLGLFFRLRYAVRRRRWLFPPRRRRRWLFVQRRRPV